MVLGFRADYSTEAVIRVLNDFIAADCGQHAVLLLLDLSAAFDTVDHSILTGRLKNWVGNIFDTKSVVLYRACYKNESREHFG